MSSAERVGGRRIGLCAGSIPHARSVSDAVNLVGAAHLAPRIVLTRYQRRGPGPAETDQNHQPPAHPIAGSEVDR